jgi:hypothetical protein
MKKTVLILAALLVALTAFATAPAFAGGKRLQFGYPLGSFKAKSHSGPSYKRHRSRRKSRYAARKAAARRAAARKAAARKAAARRHAAKKAHARKLAAKKAAAKRAARLAAARKAAKARKLAAKSAEAKKVAAVTETAEKDDDVKLAPVRASAIAGANTLDLDEDDVAALETEVEVNDEAAGDSEVAEENIETEEDFDDTAELECKKFIPSAGLTISVACGS